MDNRFIVSVPLLLCVMHLIPASGFSEARSSADMQGARLQDYAFPDALFASDSTEYTRSQQRKKERESRYSSSSTGRLFLEGEFLYWLVKQEGDQYALTGSALTVPGTVDPNTGEIPGPIQKGELHELDFKATPGYKVGGGINFAQNRWDVYAEYTHLHTHAKGSVTSDHPNTSIIPSFSYTANNSILSYASYANPATAQGFVALAKSHWDLAFNNLNLEVGRNAHPWKALSLRPFLGVQGSWQTQEFDVDYQVHSLDQPQTVLGNNKVKFHQRFWGVGLRLGIDSTWHCVRHLDVFGDLATALLWGQFNCKGASYDTNSIQNYQDVLIDKQINDPHSLSPMMTLAIGLQSSWSFRSRYQLAIKAGWEGQIWFFQNQHASSIPDSSLILQGFTAGLLLGF